MPDSVPGRRLVCEESDSVVLSLEEIESWQFWDYSWACPECWRLHCSECSYATDGETITVRDCGRFGDSLYTPGSREAEVYGCRCPTIDNHRGAGFGEPTQWVIDATCPIHNGIRTVRVP